MSRTVTLSDAEWAEVRAALLARSGQWEDGYPYDTEDDPAKSYRAYRSLKTKWGLR